jgi:DNA-binding phage protein
MRIEHALHQVLKRRNYPIARFARDIGITRSHVYRILRGHHSPTLQTVKRMCDALDMSLSEFIGMVEREIPDS